MSGKPRLLLISHVLPLSASSGQQQRVAYSIEAARTQFEVTLLTTAEPERRQEVASALRKICDEAIVLPSALSPWRRVRATIYRAATGLKTSNYYIQADFSPARISAVLASRDRFDCALFEYWHAVASIPVFHQQRVPCVLDMHDILWRSYQRQLEAASGIPTWWKRRALEQYKRSEEQAWRQFDGLIAINREELHYAAARLPADVRTFYTPMGIDLDYWPYGLEPASPPRVAYYGGLASPHNQRSALECYQQVLPLLWKERPETEFWIIGSNPPDSIRELQRDPRVRVTGFVENVAAVLKTMSVLVCPWSGRYGFRSRLIEAMALGLPVVASADAIFGMDLDPGEGLLLAETPRQFADCVTNLLVDSEYRSRHSRAARQQVEARFSFFSTYGNLFEDMADWLAQDANRYFVREAGGLLT